MNELTAEYAKAADLDRKIKVSAQLAQQSLYDMCMGLKEMRDNKLYKELGYQNFEEYCENEVGIKRNQAMKYAKIAEIENAQSTVHFEKIGTEKLYLLAKLDEPQREEIQQNVDLETTSVRELKEKIDSLKKTNDRLMSKVDEAEKNAEKSRKSEEAACGKLSILQTDTEFQKQKIAQLESELESKKNSITALEEQVEELESRPVEVAVAETDSHEIENLKDAMKRVDLDWSLKYNELQESNLKESIEKNKAHTAEIEKLKAEYEEKLANTAKSGADCKEVFKVYLANAIDTVKRLISFANDHPEEKLFKEKIKKLLIGIDKNTEE